MEIYVSSLNQCQLLFFCISISVHGNWGDWGEYSNCSKSCDGGVQKKTRFCNSPLPSNGGLECLLTDEHGNVGTYRGTNESVSRSCNMERCNGEYHSE